MAEHSECLDSGAVQEGRSVCLSRCRAGVGKSKVGGMPREFYGGYTVHENCEYRIYRNLCEDLDVRTTLYRAEIGEKPHLFDLYCNYGAGPKGMNTKRRNTCRAHRPLSRVSAACAMRAM